jgi:hypothetical protein
MTEDDKLLVELMLHSEVICTHLEAAGKKALALAEMHVLSLKISQCRNAIAQLQSRYETDDLTIEDDQTCADFRTAVISLLWASFIARDFVDRKLFRKLLQVESGFTYLLISRRRGQTTT